MSKAAVIFWSQTGNTEQMANAIADGIREGGMEVDVLNVADTTPADAVKYAKIALGYFICQMMVKFRIHTDYQPVPCNHINVIRMLIFLHFFICRTFCCFHANPPFLFATLSAFCACPAVPA